MPDNLKRSLARLTDAIRFARQDRRGMPTDRVTVNVQDLRALVVEYHKLAQRLEEKADG